MKIFLSREEGEGEEEEEREREREEVEGKVIFSSGFLYPETVRENVPE